MDQVKQAYTDFENNSASMTDAQRQAAAQKLQVMMGQLSAADQAALATGVYADAGGKMYDYDAATHTVRIDGFFGLSRAILDKNVNTIVFTQDIDISGMSHRTGDQANSGGHGLWNANGSGNGGDAYGAGASSNHSFFQGIARNLTIDGNNHSFIMGTKYIQFWDQNYNGTSNGWHITVKNFSNLSSSSAHEAPFYFYTNSDNAANSSVTYENDTINLSNSWLFDNSTSTITVKDSKINANTAAVIHSAQNVNVQNILSGSTVSNADFITGVSGTVTLDGVNMTITNGSLVDSNASTVNLSGNNIVTNNNDSYGYDTIKAGYLNVTDGSTNITVTNNGGASGNSYNYHGNIIYVQNDDSGSQKSVNIAAGATLTLKGNTDTRGIVTKWNVQSTQGTVNVDGTYNANMGTGHSNAIVAQNLTIGKNGAVNIETKQDNKADVPEYNWSNATATLNGWHQAVIALNTGGVASALTNDLPATLTDNGSLVIKRVTNGAKTFCPLIAFGNGGSGDDKMVYTLTVGDGATLDLQDDGDTSFVTNLSNPQKNSLKWLNTAADQSENPITHVSPWGLISMLGGNTKNVINFNHPGYVNLQRTGSQRGSLIREEGMAQNEANIDGGTAGIPLAQWNMDNKTNKPDEAWYIKKLTSQAAGNDFFSNFLPANMDRSTLHGDLSSQYWGIPFSKSNGTAELVTSGGEDYTYSNGSYIGATTEEANQSRLAQLTNDFSWWAPRRLSFGSKLTDNGVDLTDAQQFDPVAKTINTNTSKKLSDLNVEDGIDYIAKSDGTHLDKDAVLDVKGNKVDWTKSKWGLDWSYTNYQPTLDVNGQIQVDSNGNVVATTKDGKALTGDQQNQVNALYAFITHAATNADGTLKLGSTKNTATIVYTDGSADFVNIPINVKKPDAEIATEIAKSVVSYDGYNEYDKTQYADGREYGPGDLIANRQPNTAKIVWGTAPDFTTPGLQHVTVIVTLQDGTRYEVPTIVNVRSDNAKNGNEAEQNLPESVTITARQNDDLSGKAKDAISNHDELTNVVSYEWVGETPSTATAGISLQHVKITYQDGSSENVPVYVRVFATDDTNIDIPEPKVITTNQVHIKDVTKIQYDANKSKKLSVAFPASSFVENNPDEKVTYAFDSDTQKLFDKYDDHTIVEATGKHVFNVGIIATYADGSTKNITARLTLLEPPIIKKIFTVPGTVPTPNDSWLVNKGNDDWAPKSIGGYTSTPDVNKHGVNSDTYAIIPVNYKPMQGDLQEDGTVKNPNNAYPQLDFVVQIIVVNPDGESHYLWQNAQNPYTTMPDGTLSGTQISGTSVDKTAAWGDYIDTYGNNDYYDKFPNGTVIKSTWDSNPDTSKPGDYHLTQSFTFPDSAMEGSTDINGNYVAYPADLTNLPKTLTVPARLTVLANPVTQKIDIKKGETPAVTAGVTNIDVSHDYTPQKAVWADPDQVKNDAKKAGTYYETAIVTYLNPLYDSSKPESVTNTKTLTKQCQVKVVVGDVILQGKTIYVWQNDNVPASLASWVSNAPAGSTFTFDNGTPTTNAAGSFSIPITVLSSDGVTYKATATLNVRALPQSKTLTTPKGVVPDLSTISADDLIKNLHTDDTTGIYPISYQTTWITKPDVSQIGSTTGKVLVTYYGSEGGQPVTHEMVVPVNVVEPHDATGTTYTVWQNALADSDLNNSATMQTFLKHLVTFNSDHTGATIAVTSPAGNFTNDPGTKSLTLRITYADGTTQDVTGTVRVRALPQSNTLTTPKGVVPDLSKIAAADLIKNQHPGDTTGLYPISYQTTWITAPDVSKIGSTHGTVRVTYYGIENGQPVTHVMVVPVNVVEPHDATGQTYTVWQHSLSNSDLNNNATMQDFLKNLVHFGSDHTGATIAVTSGTGNFTDTPGTKSLTLRITYADGTTQDVTSTLRVRALPTSNPQTTTGTALRPDSSWISNLQSGDTTGLYPTGIASTSVLKVVDGKGNDVTNTYYQTAGVYTGTITVDYAGQATHTLQVPIMVTNNAHHTYADATWVFRTTPQEWHKTDSNVTEGIDTAFPTTHVLTSIGKYVIVQDNNGSHYQLDSNGNPVIDTFTLSDDGQTYSDGTHSFSAADVTVTWENGYQPVTNWHQIEATGHPATTDTTMYNDPAAKDSTGNSRNRIHITVSGQAASVLGMSGDVGECNLYANYYGSVATNTMYVDSDGRSVIRSVDANGKESFLRTNTDVTTMNHSTSTTVPVFGNASNFFTQYISENGLREWLQYHSGATYTIDWSSLSDLQNTLKTLNGKDAQGQYVAGNRTIAIKITFSDTPDNPLTVNVPVIVINPKDENNNQDTIVDGDGTIWDINLHPDWHKITKNSATTGSPEYVPANIVSQIIKSFSRITSHTDTVTGNEVRVFNGTYTYNAEHQAYEGYDANNVFHSYKASDFILTWGGQHGTPGSLDVDHTLDAFSDADGLAWSKRADRSDSLTVMNDNTLFWPAEANGKGYLYIDGKAGTNLKTDVFYATAPVREIRPNFYGATVDQNNPSNVLQFDNRGRLGKKDSSGRFVPDASGLTMSDFENPSDALKTTVTNYLKGYLTNSDYDTLNTKFGISNLTWHPGTSTTTSTDGSKDGYIRINFQDGTYLDVTMKYKTVQIDSDKYDFSQGRSIWIMQGDQRINKFIDQQGNKAFSYSNMPYPMKLGQLNFWTNKQTGKLEKLNNVTYQWVGTANTIDPSQPGWYETANINGNSVLVTFDDGSTATFRLDVLVLDQPIMLPIDVPTGYVIDNNSGSLLFADYGKGAGYINSLKWLQRPNTSVAGEAIGRAVISYDTNVYKRDSDGKIIYTVTGKKHIPVVDTTAHPAFGKLDQSKLNHYALPVNNIDVIDGDFIPTIVRGTTSTLVIKQNSHGTVTNMKFIDNKTGNVRDNFALNKQGQLTDSKGQQLFSTTTNTLKINHGANIPTSEQLRQVLNTQLLDSFGVNYMASPENLKLDEKTGQATGDVKLQLGGIDFTMPLKTSFTILPDTSKDDSDKTTPGILDPVKPSTGDHTAGKNDHKGQSTPDTPSTSGKHDDQNQASQGNSGKTEPTNSSTGDHTSENDNHKGQATPTKPSDKPNDQGQIGKGDSEKPDTSKPTTGVHIGQTTPTKSSDHQGTSSDQHDGPSQTSKDNSGKTEPTKPATGDHTPGKDDSHKTQATPSQPVHDGDQGQTSQSQTGQGESGKTESTKPATGDHTSDKNADHEGQATPTKPDHSSTSDKQENQGQTGKDNSDKTESTKPVTGGQTATEDNNHQSQTTTKPTGTSGKDENQSSTGKGNSGKTEPTKPATGDHTSGKDDSNKTQATPSQPVKHDGDQGQTGQGIPTKPASGDHTSGKDNDHQGQTMPTKPDHSSTPVKQENQGQTGQKDSGKSKPTKPVTGDHTSGKESGHDGQTTPTKSENPSISGKHENQGQTGQENSGKTEPNKPTTGDHASGKESDHKGQTTPTKPNHSSTSGNHEGQSQTSKGESGKTEPVKPVTGNHASGKDDNHKAQTVPSEPIKHDNQGQTGQTTPTKPSGHQGISGKHDDQSQNGQGNSGRTEPTKPVTGDHVPGKNDGHKSQFTPSKPTKDDNQDQTSQTTPTKPGRPSTSGKQEGQSQIGKGESNQTGSTKPVTGDHASDKETDHNGQTAPAKPSDHQDISGENQSQSGKGKSGKTESTNPVTGNHTSGKDDDHKSQTTPTKSSNHQGTLSDKHDSQSQNGKGESGQTTPTNPAAGDHTSGEKAEHNSQTASTNPSADRQAQNGSLDSGITKSDHTDSSATSSDDYAGKAEPTMSVSRDNTPMSSEIPDQPAYPENNNGLSTMQSSAVPVNGIGNVQPQPAVKAEHANATQNLTATGIDVTNTNNHASKESTKLPQTGNHEQRSVLALAVISLCGILGLAKKRRHE